MITNKIKNDIFELCKLHSLKAITNKYSLFQ